MIEAAHEIMTIGIMHLSLFGVASAIMAILEGYFGKKANEELQTICLICLIMGELIAITGIIIGFMAKEI